MKVFKYIKKVNIFFKISFIFLIIPLFAFCHYFPKNRAPNSFYISGDSFRAFCDFVYDEVDSSLNPFDIKNGDVVFVKTDYLPKFFERIHPNIEHKYIIVTHNSDDKVNKTYLKYLNDDKIIVWFAQNMDLKHKKLKPIPIGMANRCWPHGNVYVMDEVKARAYTKKHLAYLNIYKATYPRERIGVFVLFKDKNFCLSREKVSYENYLIDTANSKFVISPRGNGLDTHRLWEALYLQAIPIVKTSNLDALYEDLPVLIIQDWKEITEEFLLQKYEEMQKKEYNLQKLGVQYWYELISSFKASS